MALSDLQVFSEYAYSTMTEMLDQQVEIFNGATRGGIVLQSAARQGDYSDEAFWAKIDGLVRRRDAYGSGPVAEKNIEHLLRTSVKVAAGTPPVRIDPGMMKWIQRSPEEAGAVVGQQLGKDALGDMLNTAIMGYVSAVAQVADVVHDATSADNLDLRALNRGASKFGDASQSIVCWAMHSKCLFDVYDVALVNSNRLFQFGNVQVVSDGFGRPLVVSDSPSFIEVEGVGAGVDKYHTLGLTPGALVVERNNDYTDNVETKNGDENIIRTFQAEWTYNLGIKGFAWDKASGGASPTSAALASAANWDRYSTSHKDLAGVIVESK